MPELVVVAEQLLAPVPGGTGRYTRELLRALAATAPRGWEVRTVVGAGGEASRAEVEGVRGPRVLPLPRRALALAWQHGRGPRVGGDSVHAPTPLFPPVGRGTGLVVSVHDTVPWTHPATLTPRGVSWHRRMVSRAARKADYVVVPTEAVAADLACRVRGPARLEVVPEGVTSRVASGADCPELVRRLDPPRRFLLVLGTVEPRKGHETVISALAEPGLEGVSLLVVGKPGWGGVDPPGLAERHGLERSRVRWFDSVDDAELAALLRRASALVAPSLAEGFGLPVVEAMAAGVPVVHSDAPALVEVAGGAGVAVPRGDPGALAAALREVLGDPRRSAGLVETGRQRAARFDWRDSARRIWRLHTGR
ncbi:glycosyltransferase family 4 protein [Actinopolyspora saharensis]|uniref:Glycosyltransferase involved in cell wall bisynthesis n=1 Tax=Actinopolyspora saharensis TaxID=995062 RepID=A0A1H1EA47_9ACTN|nr:glycosyltransferase family 1 protein [Actinopolyspora saharensis]SDQ85681.1 Glycosyltransferase involved in cell wall bisynthesis [Actinopolyspora saharensis]